MLLFLLVIFQIITVQSMRSKAWRFQKRYSFFISKIGDASKKLIVVKKMVFTPYPDFLLVYNSQDLSISQRLVLPSDHRKYYPSPLPQTAILQKPEGNFWTVRWATSEEKAISFEDGWSKFVTDNDPIDGDFLVFAYDGSRSFFVSIFRDGSVVKPKAPVKIQEISDDDDEDETTGNDDDDYKEANDQNMVISLSLGSSDEDNADARIGEVNKAHAISKKGRSSQKKRAESIGDPEMYLDDPSNPCFIANSSCRPLCIAMQVIKDYCLKFGSTINFIDQFGELEGKFGNWNDRVVVLNWEEIYKRNDAKPTDIIICEILREGGVVRSIKAHFIKK